MKSRRKIRNFLLDETQLDFSLKYFAVAVLSIVLTIIVMYISVWNVIAEYVPQAVLKDLAGDMVRRMIVLGIPMAGAMIALIIVISHRFMGPIYKIGLHLDMIIKEETGEPIRIRKNDALKPLVEKLNKILTILGQRR